MPVRRRFAAENSHPVQLRIDAAGFAMAYHPNSK